MIQQFRSYPDTRQFRSAYIRGERPRLSFSRHAAQRFAEMRITEDELFNVLAKPLHVGYSAKYDAVTIQGERIAVSVMLDRYGYPEVATILWRTREDWAEASERGHMGEGRRVKLTVPTRADRAAVAR
ncbi:hypothetical protein SK224_07980 [Microbacterium sp. BG28]|uniref:hypothetical protein n=1 Tax=Microbacterium sp. BG28 TaxID=3097356 RepID=UPI002A5A8A45|nr:hypothetical protein [Microbacterium sp. BG28]MDY0829065.1 hypothetical protein [Microbacterium sp. BG28]